MEKESSANGPGQGVVTKGECLPAPHFGAFAHFERAIELQDDLTICGDILDVVKSRSRRSSGNTSCLQRRLLRVEAMLGVISYCYVKGIFTSDEIERRFWRDPDFLATFGEELPTAQAIRNFRRQYHSTIVDTIERALERFQQRTGGASHAPSIGTGVDVVLEAIHDKATYLISMAGIMDQLSSDL